MECCLWAEHGAKHMGGITRGSGSFSVLDPGGWELKPHWVILGKSLNLSAPQFSHL